MRTIGFLLCLFFTTNAVAQSPVAQIKGQVLDSFFNKSLAYATVSLVKAKDSSLVSFTRADSAGRFSLKGLDKGEYLLSIAYVGYLPTWQPIALKTGEQLNMGMVYLTDVQHASAVTVNARRPPVTINNDTVEFNTENFKTAPNAVVEDLLKRLPGVTVDKDGTVKVNGQRVSRFLVNGKEFFTGDPKMATQNLDADAVDKVQVFDRKSDRAEFTGMEDGQTSKAINLKLKKDRDKSTFGRVVAGAGTAGRVEARGNVNRFNGDQQISFLGMANNTNKQGFSLQDVMNFTGELARGMRSGGGVNIRVGGGDDNGLPISGMGQNQQGIAETYAGGLNYNNSWNKKTDLNLNGVLSDINLVTDQDVTRKNILPGNAFDYFSNSSNVKRAQQQRLVATWDQKIDSFTSLRYVPQLTWQQGQQSQLSTYRSISEAGQPMNEGRTRQVKQSSATNLEGNFLLRHKFRKKGRTISATLAHAYNESRQNGELQTLNRFFVSGLPLRDSIQNQNNSRHATTRSVGGNLVYTEPLGKKTLLEANVYLNTNNSETQKKVFDFNSTTGKYDQPNALLSNDFKSDYVYGGGGLSIRSNIKKFSLTGGANLQASTLTSINQSRQTHIRQQFTDWLPLANVQYKVSNTSSLTLNYNTSTVQPSAQQLQPVPDVSDPLNTYIGNPNLKRSYQHAANLSFTSFDIYRQRNLFGFVSFTQTQDAIVNADFVQANGARTSTPVNRNGNFFLLGNLSAGWGIKKLKSRIELGMQTSMFRNQSLFNGTPNVIDNIAYTPNLNYQFSIDSVMDVLLTARVGFNQIRYSQQPQLNDNYLQQNYGIELTNYLPGGIILVNNFDLALNTGRADGFNVNVPLWNISLAKSFLKYKKGELKLSLMDALNRNIGINRVGNMNFIQDTRYTVLRQYWMLSFTYRLNRANSKGGPQLMIRTM